jgi:hypothetical protein
MMNTTLGKYEITAEMQVRFWRKVQKLGPDECWTWVGKVNGKNYGRFSFSRTIQLLANRVSLAIALGNLDDDQMACHHCDNPSCVNPLHLYAGDAESNARDAVVRGRLRSANAAKTHCQNGHEFNADNTFLKFGGRRGCRICRLEWSRRKRHKTSRTVPSRAGRPVRIA